jgi:hypothetical protein
MAPTSLRTPAARESRRSSVVGFSAPDVQPVDQPGHADSQQERVERTNVSTRRSAVVPIENAAMTCVEHPGLPAVHPGAPELCNGSTRHPRGEVLVELAVATSGPRRMPRARGCQPDRARRRAERRPPTYGYRWRLPRRSLVDVSGEALPAREGKGVGGRQAGVAGADHGGAESGAGRSRRWVRMFLGVLLRRVGVLGVVFLDEALEA